MPKQTHRTKDINKTLGTLRMMASRNETVEQSTSIIFIDDKALVFDGEMLVCCPSPFEELSGAIPAEETKVLTGFTGESVEVELTESELLFSQKRRKAGIRRNAEVLSPCSLVPTPTKFRRLKQSIRSRILQAGQCCSRDESDPRTTHIHITPDRIEGTDTIRVFRSKGSTGFKSSVLIHNQNMLRLFKLGDIVGVCQDEGEYIHFKMDSGFIVSILQCAGDFYDEEVLTGILTPSAAKKIEFPKNILEVVERVEQMEESEAGSWRSNFSISLKDGKALVRAQKEDGWFSEAIRVQYKGPAFRFSIHPDLLKALLQCTSKMLLEKNRLLVLLDDSEYATALDHEES